MIETALGIVTTEMSSIGVPYEFMRWSAPHCDLYWVGEYSETPTDTEDGYEEGTLLLTGTTTKAWSMLMQDRAKIKSHFPSIGGLCKSTSKGTVAIFYENSFPVPTDTAELKRMQINLKIKTWKGIN